jgi:hypothetical protein
LALRHDFEVKYVWISIHCIACLVGVIQANCELRISRAEVEEVARLLEAELEKILPGFVHTIVGGWVQLIWSLILI